MARKKPAKKAKAKSAKRTAKKKAAPKKATRRTARASKKTSRKAPKTSARKASKPASRKATKKAAPARKLATKRRGLIAGVGTAVVSVVAAGVSAALSGKKKPNLDRPRKTVADVHGIPSSLDMGRSASAARTGRAELKERLSKNTSASPALTAGDVDADWESAETVGDEAPGGDNPTPDQDVVDDIGRALGVEYEDDEELQGGAEIADRDRNRWELDPSSKDDFDEES
ncbi:MAG: DUF6335 family protein [Pirellulales bacterium]